MCCISIFHSPLLCRIRVRWFHLRVNPPFKKWPCQIMNDCAQRKSLGKVRTFRRVIFRKQHAAPTSRRILNCFSHHCHWAWTTVIYSFRNAPRRRLASSTDILATTTIQPNLRQFTHSKKQAVSQNRDTHSTTSRGPCTFCQCRPQPHLPKIR